MNVTEQSVIVNRAIMLPSDDDTRGGAPLGRWQEAEARLAALHVIRRELGAPLEIVRAHHVFDASEV